MTTTYIDGIDTSLLVVSLGVGGPPPTSYTPIVTVNANRSLSNKANSTAAVLVRTDDPTQPGETIRTATSKDSDISGDGTCSRSNALSLVAAVGTIQALQVNVGSLTGDLQAVGNYLLEEATITGQKLGDLVTIQLKWSQASAPTFSAHT